MLLGWHRKHRLGMENCAFQINLTLTFHIELLHFSYTFHSFFCGFVWFSSKNLFSLHSKSTLDEFNLHFNCMHCWSCSASFSLEEQEKIMFFLVGFLLFACSSSDTTSLLLIEDNKQF